MRVPTVLFGCIALTACATTTPPAESRTTTRDMTSSVSIPTGLTGSGDPQVQQMLGHMEEQWGAAGMKCDTATIGRMIAPEFLAVNDDHIGDRAETLSCLAPDDPNFAPVSNTDSARVVRVYGDAAVITAIGDNAVRDKKTGKTSHNIGRYTEFWVKRNGQWQAVAGAYQNAQLPKATLTQQLMRAEQDYSDIFNKRDSLAFQRIVADSVTFASGTEPVETKAQLWDDVKASDVRTNVIHVDRAYVSGNGVVGVVNGTIDRTLKNGSALHLRYANTWVYRGGTWFLLARQLVPATTNTR